MNLLLELLIAIPVSFLVTGWLKANANRIATLVLTTASAISPTFRHTPSLDELLDDSLEVKGSESKIIHALHHLIFGVVTLWCHHLSELIGNIFDTTDRHGTGTKLGRTGAIEIERVLTGVRSSASSVYRVLGYSFSGLAIITSQFAFVVVFLVIATEPAGAMCPIVIDLNKDGKISITGLTTSRFKFEPESAPHHSFDLNGDGFAETIGWVAKNSGDGILVDDRDGLASISMNGQRLFGDLGRQFENGYEKLRLFDTNHDGRVCGSELTGLKIWADDGDARVDGGELRELSDYSITCLSLHLNQEMLNLDQPLMQSVASTSTGDTYLTEDVWFAVGDLMSPKVLTDIQLVLPLTKKKPHIRATANG